jgi:hypothetical protein
VIGISWDSTEDPNRILLTLPHEPGTARDTVDAVVAGDAALAFDAGRLSDLIDALGLTRIRIGAATPARLEAVDGTPLSALFATASWAKPNVGRVAA